MSQEGFLVMYNIGHTYLVICTNKESQCTHICSYKTETLKNNEKSHNNKRTQHTTLQTHTIYNTQISFNK